MSPRERSAWIRLASILVVFIPYFQYILRLFHGDGPIAQAICIAFVAAALAHGLLNALGQIALTLIFGREIRDERDRAIDGVSLQVAYFTLIALVLGALGTLAFLGAITPPSSSGRILLPTFSVATQFVFFCFVSAEVLRHLVQLVCYRREALA